MGNDTDRNSYYNKIDVYFKTYYKNINININGDLSTSDSDSNIDDNDMNINQQQ